MRNPLPIGAPVRHTGKARLAPERGVTVTIAAWEGLICQFGPQGVAHSPERVGRQVFAAAEASHAQAKSVVGYPAGDFGHSGLHMDEGPAYPHPG